MAYRETSPTGGPRRLTRSTRERMWAGVCAGLATYFDLDPTLMRVIWVAAAIVTSGLAVLGYIVLWFVMPRDDAIEAWPPATAGAPASGDAGRDETSAASASGVTQESSPMQSPPTFGPPRFDPPDRARRQRTAGIILIVLGALFFAGQIGVFWWFRWDLMWPLLLIGVGLFLLLRRADWRRW